MSIEKPKVETDGRRSRESLALYEAWQRAVADAEAMGESGDYRGVAPIAREAKRLRTALGGNPAEPWWYEP